MECLFVFSDVIAAYRDNLKNKEKLVFARGQDMSWCQFTPVSAAPQTTQHTGHVLTSGNLLLYRLPPHHIGHVLRSGWVVFFFKKGHFITSKI